jgi:general stress protein YciG
MANNDNNTSNRGLANADDETRRRVASEGGKSQGAENNPANFANDREKASRAGKKGGESRNSGGQNS